jgi:multidrug resistance efflux pump
VIFVLIAGAVIGWLLWQQGRPRPFVVSGFVEADQVRVGSRVGGRVAEVHVSEGQAVQAGQALFRIAPFDLQEQLSQAQAELAARRAEHGRLIAGFRVEEIDQARARRDQAQAVLEKLEAGPRPGEIEIARERVHRAEANLDLAKTEHERLARLRAANQAADVEYERAVRELKAAQADLAATKADLALLEEGTLVEDIAQAKAALAEAAQALALLEAGYRREDVEQSGARVKAAEASVAAIQVRVDELSVESPCDCRVEAIDLRPGDLVPQNAPTVSLLDLSRVWVRAYVPEGRLGELNVGKRVPVRVDSYPRERFPAEVTFIAQEAEFTPRNLQTPEERSKQVFRIKVTLLEGIDRLRVGMAADVLLSEP